MCVSIPVRVVAVEADGTAIVDAPGGRQRVALFWVDAAVGDWLLAHSGIALDRIDGDEARARLALIDRGR
jgi:hydrogenase expression/formation protein HypC